MKIDKRDMITGLETAYDAIDDAKTHKAHLRNKSQDEIALLIKRCNRGKCFFLILTKMFENYFSGLSRCDGIDLNKQDDDVIELLNLCFYHYFRFYEFVNFAWDDIEPILKNANLNFKTPGIFLGYAIRENAINIWINPSKVKAETLYRAYNEFTVHGDVKLSKKLETYVKRLCKQDQIANLKHWQMSKMSKMSYIKYICEKEVSESKNATDITKKALKALIDSENELCEFLNLKLRGLW